MGLLGGAAPAPGADRQAAAQRPLLGTIIVTAYGGRNLPNKDLFGRMDPYLTLSLDQVNVQKTTVHRSGGRSPIWNETFALEVRSDEARRALYIECWDWDRVGRDLIGTSEFLLSRLWRSSGHEVFDWIPLWSQSGKSAGEVRLHIKYESPPVVNIPPTMASSTADKAVPAPAAELQPAAAYYGLRAYASSGSLQSQYVAAAAVDPAAAPQGYYQYGFMPVYAGAPPFPTYPGAYPQAAYGAPYAMPAQTTAGSATLPARPQPAAPAEDASDPFTQYRKSAQHQAAVQAAAAAAAVASLATSPEKSSGAHSPGPAADYCFPPVAKPEQQSHEAVYLGLIDDLIPATTLSRSHSASSARSRAASTPRHSPKPADASLAQLPGSLRAAAAPRRHSVPDATRRPAADADDLAIPPRVSSVHVTGGTLGTAPSPARTRVAGAAASAAARAVPVGRRTSQPEHCVSGLRAGVVLIPRSRSQSSNAKPLPQVPLSLAASASSGVPADTQVAQGPTTPPRGPSLSLEPRTAPSKPINVPGRCSAAAETGYGGRQAVSVNASPENPRYKSTESASSSAGRLTALAHAVENLFGPLRPLTLYDPGAALPAAAPNRAGAIAGRSPVRVNALPLGTNGLPGSFESAPLAPAAS